MARRRWKKVLGIFLLLLLLLITLGITFTLGWRSFIGFPAPHA
jgi:hypothetical protein